MMSTFLWDMKPFSRTTCHIPDDSTLENKVLWKIFGPKKEAMRGVADKSLTL
jgi:hypothetical protein